MNNDSQAIVVDGFSLIYRAYFATKNQLEHQLKNNRTPTNALEMTLIMLSKLLKQKPYRYGLIAFDAAHRTFRTEIFDAYKSNRKKMDAHLETQIPLIQTAAELMGFKVLAVPNFEADDIIGTFTAICANHGVTADVFSSDNDLLQLVSP